LEDEEKLLDAAPFHRNRFADWRFGVTLACSRPRTVVSNQNVNGHVVAIGRFACIQL
jgi:hypothetical protein